MIEANELRIGNKIRRISNDNICTVNWGIIREFELGETRRQYEPIRLEFHIFDKIKDVEYVEPTSYYIFDIPIHAGHHEWWYWSRGIVKGYPKEGLAQDQNWGKGARVRLDYLHELQNLIFALTKKELIYNP